MNLKEYQAWCKNTAQEFNEKQTELLMWGLGIAGEAGDVASCINKTVAHKNDHKAGIKENLGDTLWYMAMICNHFGWSLQDVLEENVQKLQQRYPQGFSQKAAQEKKTTDWNEK